MSRCLYCGAELNSSSAHFCRGHHRPYRTDLINQWYNSAEGSQEREDAGRKLRRFPGWWDYDNACPVRVTRSQSRSTERSHMVARPARVNTPITGAFRKFGIELETVSSNSSVLNEAVQMLSATGINIRDTGYNHNDVNYWKVLTDASLSGGYCREIVSPAFSTEAGFQQVYQVAATLTTMGVKVNNTCGFHCHLDASDLTPKQIARIAKFYQVYESEIDKLHQGSRRGNPRYTKTLRDIRLPENPSSMDAVRSAFHYDRYFKVNVEAYLRHGTIEFRQHGATVDPTKIVYWIKFCSRIVEFAKTENEIDARTPLFDALNLSADERIYWNHRKEVLAA